MFLVFALIATLPLVALSYLAIDETRSALADEVGRSHEDTARAAAGFVGVYVENGRVLLAAQAARASMRNATTDAALQDELTAFATRSTYNGRDVFQFVLYANASGTVVASIPPGAAAAGTDISASAEFQEPIRRAGLVQLEVPPGGARTLPLAVPVTSDGALRGVLVAFLDLRRLGEDLQDFSHGNGEALLLTDASGRPLVEVGDARAEASWATTPPVLGALNGTAGHLEFMDPTSGELALAGFAPVPRLGWAVVDIEPAREAYAAVTRLTAILIVLSGVLIGAILLASVILARRIVKPVRALTVAAGSLASGQLSARIEPGAKDEIGELAEAFNVMAERIRESLDGLRRSEARYRNLVESADDVILTIDPDLSLSFVSNVAERLLGWSATDLVGRPVSVLLGERDADRFLDAVHDVLERGEPVLWLMHHVHPRGGSPLTFRSNLSPVLGGDGKPSRVLVVSRDITLQRREERFRESSFQMARLVSEETDLERLVREGLVIALSAGSYARGAVYISDQGTLREATGGAEAQHEWARLAARAVETRRIAPHEGVVALPLLERGEALGALVVAGPAGEDSDVDADALPALASQLAVGIRRSLFEGRLKGYAAELETRVQERTAELQAKSEEMETFLYSVSHDLKAPLISIEGYAQGLQEDYASLLAGDGALYLDRIRKNASLMESLILDLLELSRIGRASVDVAEVDTDEVLAGVAARLGDRFEHAAGRLEVQAGLPRLSGDRNRIEQLFNNLVENAYKYRHPQRPPVVRVEGERSSNGVVVLRVVDNGRGIPESGRDKLFQVFHRLPTPSGMPDPGGTGMGLAIVKRIVDVHRGRILLESAEGKGTTFTVELPAAE